MVMVMMVVVVMVQQVGVIAQDVTDQGGLLAGAVSMAGIAATVVVVVCVVIGRWGR